MCHVKCLAQGLNKQSSQLFLHYFFEAERPAGKLSTAIRGDVGRWSATNATAVANNIKRKRSLSLFGNQNGKSSRFEKVNQKKLFPSVWRLNWTKKSFFQKLDLKKNFLIFQNASSRV